MTETVPTLVNGKWALNLPTHRAARPQWGDWTDDKGTARFGWETERLRSMSLNIGPGDYVWDVGSEEADLTALYQSWIGSGDGGVVLMEPNPLVWPNAKLIWEDNRLKPPVFCWVGFAGNEDRGFDRPVDLDRDSVWPECADGPVIADHGFAQLNECPDIPAIRLDTLREWIGAPSVITIDCEGSEYEVLKGAGVILQEHKPLVFVSIHKTFMLDQYNTHPDDLHQLMCDLGYREKLLAIDHEEHWAMWNPMGRELRM